VQAMREWWRGGVIYQVYPRSFQDTDGNGIGDLAGIMHRLDHVARLGVDCIWLSPIFQSPQADMGYDISDYKQIDPVFGQLADFDQLIQRAHSLGLKVIVDQVLSHTSDLHPWFQESRLSRTNARADWYVWADPKRDGSPPNNWPAVFGGRAWEWNPSRGQYYMHNFLAQQPDLNYHNPAVQDAVLDVLRFWLERGVDGFRLDAINYSFHDAQLRNNPAARRPKHLPYAVNPYDMQEHRYSKSQPEILPFLKRVRSLMNKFPNAMTVGEVGDSHKGLQLMADYTGGGDKLNMCYTFDLLGVEFTAEHFRTRIQRFFNASTDGWACWSFSNHDVPRHISRWAAHARDLKVLARQTIALLIALKGSICIYQGEELGLPEADLRFEELTDPRGIRFWPEDKGRDGCRTPMPWEEGDAPNGFTGGKPWLPVKPEHSVLSVAAQEKDAASTLHYYRKALEFRRQHDSLSAGEIDFVKAGEPVLAFRRSKDGEVLLCVFNLSADTVKIKLTGEAEMVFSEAAERKRETLTLGPNGFAYFWEAPEAPKLHLEFKRRATKKA
jgi:alpha-glucosidase